MRSPMGMLLMRANRYWIAALLAGVTLLASADQPRQLEVAALDFEPQIDGDLSEWRLLEPYLIRITPAIDDDSKNRTGTIEVEFWCGVIGDRLHVAARWPDDAPDTDFRPWEWRNNKYRRSKVRDDMFALRFAMAGEYNRSMIADANYVVDVWVWSAGRSNKIGKASDYKHSISLDLIEDVAEYQTEAGNTVYIDRDKDEGYIGYRSLKPGKDKTVHRVPSIDADQPASGSIADVTAKGVWRNGYWELEMQRLLDTGHADDARLFAGLEILGQIAVFNKIGSKHKSISEPLLFRFAK